MNTERLGQLLDVTNRLLEGGPNEYPLDFSVTECGSYRCLLGWYEHFVYGRTKNAADNYLVRAMDEFGIDLDLADRLFGYKSVVGLDDDEIGDFGGEVMSTHEQEAAYRELLGRRRIILDLLDKRDV